MNKNGSKWHGVGVPISVRVAMVPEMVEEEDEDA